ncbi:uncharacterized protein [Diadema setosum]|uniref:uncharacterized protein n=1 Tax=Diadema setosum TaxID=31175 RepID=UPI003B3B39B7
MRNTVLFLLTLVTLETIGFSIALRKPTCDESLRLDCEYRYLYESQILTGVSLDETKDFSGLKLTSVVKLQYVEADHFVLQLSQPSLRKFQGKIEDPAVRLNASLFDTVEGAEQDLLLSDLTKRVDFEYDRGQFLLGYFQNDDGLDSVNIKLAILSLLHVDLTGSEDEDAITVNKEKLFYRVMETGIDGDCEVVYSKTPYESDFQFLANDVIQFPKRMRNITKTKNFARCNSSPRQQRAYFLNGQPCETCSNRLKLLDSSSETSYSITGDDGTFVINSVSNVAQHSLRPFSVQSGGFTTFMRQDLTLESTRRTRFGESRLIVDTSGHDIVDSLLYRFPPGEAARLSEEEWQMVIDLAEGIARDLQTDYISEDIPENFTQLVEILRRASSEELTEIFDLYGRRQANETKLQERLRQLFEDTLPLLGTGHSVVLLRERLQSENITGERAIQILTMLGFHSTFSPDFLHAHKDLCQVPLVQNSSSLFTACWLSYGSLLHKACGEGVQDQTPQDWTCDDSLLRTFSQPLYDGIHASNPEWQRLAYLKALGNAGLTNQSRNLEDLVQNPKATSDLRCQAIYSLRRLTRTQSRKHVSQILLHEFLDRENCAEVRMAAFVVLMDTKPSEPVMQILIKSLESETSRQVISFVSSHFEALKNPSMQVPRNVSKVASHLYDSLQNTDFGIQYSKSYKAGLSSEEDRVGVFSNLKYIMSPDSPFPRGGAAKLNAHLMGVSLNFLELGFRARGLQKLMDTAYTFEVDPSSDQLLHDITTQLGIATRSEAEPVINFYLKSFGNEFRGFHFPPVESELCHMTRFVQMLENLQMSFQKAASLSEGTLRVATSLGIPLTLKLSGSAVTAIDGAGAINMEPSLPQLMFGAPPSQISINGTFNPRLAVQMTGSMGVSINDAIKTGVALKVSLNSSLFLNGSVRFDIRRQDYALNLTTPTEKRPLFAFSSKPLTYFEGDADGKTVQTVTNSKKPRSMEVKPELLGVGLGASFLGPSDKLTPYSLLKGPMQFNVSLLPGESAPRELQVRLRIKDKYEMVLRDPTNTHSHYYHHFDSPLRWTFGTAESKWMAANHIHKDLQDSQIHDSIYHGHIMADYHHGDYHSESDEHHHGSLLGGYHHGDHHSGSDEHHHGSLLGGYHHGDYHHGDHHSGSDEHHHGSLLGDQYHHDHHFGSDEHHHGSLLGGYYHGDHHSGSDEHHHGSLLGGYHHGDHHSGSDEHHHGSLLGGYHHGDHQSGSDEHHHGSLLGGYYHGDHQSGSDEHHHGSLLGGYHHGDHHSGSDEHHHGHPLPLGDHHHGYHHSGSDEHHHYPYPIYNVTKMEGQKHNHTDYHHVDENGKPLQYEHSHTMYKVKPLRSTDQYHHDHHFGSDEHHHGSLLGGYHHGDHHSGSNEHHHGSLLGGYHHGDHHSGSDEHHHGSLLGGYHHGDHHSGSDEHHHGHPLPLGDHVHGYHHSGSDEHHHGSLLGGYHHGYHHSGSDEHHHGSLLGGYRHGDHHSGSDEHHHGSLLGGYHHGDHHSGSDEHHHGHPLPLGDHHHGYHHSGSDEHHHYPHPIYNVTKMEGQKHNHTDYHHVDENGRPLQYEHSHTVYKVEPLRSTDQYHRDHYFGSDEHHHGSLLGGYHHGDHHSGSDEHHHGSLLGGYHHGDHHSGSDEHHHGSLLGGYHHGDHHSGSDEHHHSHPLPLGDHIHGHHHSGSDEHHHGSLLGGYHHGDHHSGSDEHHHGHPLPLGDHHHGYHHSGSDEHHHYPHPIYNVTKMEDHTHNHTDYHHVDENGKPLQYEHSHSVYKVDRIPSADYSNQHHYAHHDGSDEHHHSSLLGDHHHGYHHSGSDEHHYYDAMHHSLVVNDNPHNHTLRYHIGGQVKEVTYEHNHPVPRPYAVPLQNHPHFIRDLPASVDTESVKKEVHTRYSSAFSSMMDRVYDYIDTWFGQSHEPVPTGESEDVTPTESTITVSSADDMARAETQKPASSSPQDARMKQILQIIDRRFGFHVPHNHSASHHGDSHLYDYHHHGSHEHTHLHRHGAYNGTDDAHFRHHYHHHQHSSFSEYFDQAFSNMDLDQFVKIVTRNFFLNITAKAADNMTDDRTIMVKLNADLQSPRHKGVELQIFPAVQLEQSEKDEATPLPLSNDHHGNHHHHHHHYDDERQVFCIQFAADLPPPFKSDEPATVPTSLNHHHYHDYSDEHYHANVLGIHHHSDEHHFHGNHDLNNGSTPQGLHYHHHSHSDEHYHWDPVGLHYHSDEHHFHGNHDLHNHSAPQGLHYHHHSHSDEHYHGDPVGLHYHSDEHHFHGNHDLHNHSAPQGLHYHHHSHSDEHYHGDPVGLHHHSDEYHHGHTLGLHRPIPSSNASARSLPVVAHDNHHHLHLDEMGMHGRGGQLAMGPQVGFSLNVGWGRTCFSDKGIALKGKFERSNAQREGLVQDSPMVTQCKRDKVLGNRFSPACKDVMKKRDQLQAMHLQLSHRHLPYSLQQVISGGLENIKHLLWGKAEAERFTDGHSRGEILLSASLSDSHNSANITLSGSHDLMRVNDIKLPLTVAPYNVRKPYVEGFMDDVLKQPFMPKCHLLSDGNITTFDHVTFPYTLSECEHVVAKDCSSLQRFTLLARGVAQKKAITLFAGANKVELTPHESSDIISIVLNEEPVEVPRYSKVVLFDNGTSSTESLLQGQDLRLKAPGPNLIDVTKRYLEYQKEMEQATEEVTTPVTTPATTPRREGNTLSLHEILTGHSEHAHHHDNHEGHHHDHHKGHHKSHSHHRQPSGEDLYWAGLTRYVELVMKDQEAEFERFYQPLLEGGADPARQLQPIETLRLIRVDGSYLIDAPNEGVMVFYDGMDIRVKISRRYQNLQCGLCGNFDGESTPETEFVGPDREVYSSGPHFARSYQLTNDECTRRADNSCLPLMTQVKKSRIIVDDYEYTCRSDLQVPQCPPTHLASKMETVVMTFTCRGTLLTCKRNCEDSEMTVTANVDMHMNCVPIP